MSNSLSRLLCCLWLLPAVCFAEPAVEIVDDSDTPVALEKPARRIVSLAPHVTESLYAVGAGEFIVGTVSYSDFPAAAMAIPVVGSYDRVNLESVVEKQPDLVIAWLEGNGPAVVERLRALGLTVFVTYPTTLPQIPKTLRDFGRLTGREAQAEQRAQDFERRLDALHASYSDKAPVKVFYQVWDQPLLSISGNTLISDVITLCGGNNVFADAPATHPVTNVESVIALDPEVIIASGMGEERPEWLDEWKRWPSITAVREQQLYFIEPSILQRHSTRIIDGAEQLCADVDRARRHHTGRPSGQPT